MLTDSTDELHNSHDPSLDMNLEWRPRYDLAGQ